MRQLLLVSLLLTGFVSVKADNFIIDQGTSTLTNDQTSAFIHFSSDHVTGTLGGHAFGNRPCFPCSSGQTINLSGSSGTLGTSDTGGSITIDGIQYFATGDLFPPPLPGVSVRGGFSFTAGSVFVPFSEDPFITLTAPFDVHGDFSGSSAGGFSFSIQFVGSGIATVVLRNLGGNHLFALQSATYSFDPPVPEPTSILLLGTALAGVLLRIRLKRKG